MLVSGLYAICCKILNRSCLVYVLPNEAAPLVARYFGRSYGQFHYDHLPKTTWAQSLAQMMRLREKTAAKDGSNKGKSRTYENLVLPPDARSAGPGLRRGTNGLCEAITRARRQYSGRGVLPARRSFAQRAPGEQGH